MTYQITPTAQQAPCVADAAPLEYWVGPDRNIIRAINGAPWITVNRRPVTQAVATAVTALLNDAVHRGVAYGPMDWHREIADTLNGVSTPGKVLYGRTLTGAGITMTVDGQTSTVFDGAKVRPAFIVADFVNELEWAFREAGRRAQA